VRARQRGVVGVVAHRLPEHRRGLVVIEVVGEIEGDLQLAGSRGRA
jgi:hypothetical protein